MRRRRRRHTRRRHNGGGVKIFLRRVEQISQLVVLENALHRGAIHHPPAHGLTSDLAIENHLRGMKEQPRNQKNDRTYAHSNSTKKRKKSYRFHAAGGDQTINKHGLFLAESVTPPRSLLALMQKFTQQQQQQHHHHHHQHHQQQQQEQEEHVGAT